MYTFLFNVYIDYNVITNLIFVFSFYSFRFMSKFSFAGTVGCIDGTHVAIIRPVEHEETYFNRKKFHSLNVLIVSIYLYEYYKILFTLKCNTLNLTHVDASYYGGAAHDSLVWNQSSIKPIMEGLSNRERCWLLGLYHPTLFNSSYYVFDNYFLLF